jgi:hypothetical protein
MTSFLSKAARGLFTAAASIAFTTSCGGSTSNASGACADYFETILTRCGQQNLPASALADERSRYLIACEAAVSVPGARITVGALEACASALKAMAPSGCVLGTPAAPAACNFAATGTLPAGAACVDSRQCQSDYCDFSGDAGTTRACGVCGPTVARGQVCGYIGSPTCAPGTVCAAASTVQLTCQSVTEGDVGASCDLEAARCKQGLYCDSSTMQCTALKSAGQACTPGECAPPLVCIGGFQCGLPGQNGAPCYASSDCDPALTCVAGACAAIVWAEAGQPCGGATVCIHGNCPSPGAGSQTCPAVLADGQPCDLQTSSAVCDFVASCTGGVCVLGESASCH